MAKKQTINDLLKEYESMLGEDIDNIQPMKIEDDPLADPELAGYQKIVNQISQSNPKAQKVEALLKQNEADYEKYNNKPQPKPKAPTQQTQPKPGQVKCQQPAFQSQTDKKQPQQQQNFPSQTKSASKILSSHLDQQTVLEKFQELLKSHKRTHNLATYLMTHFKQERVNDINSLVSALETGKQLREEFQQGTNPPIGLFLMREMSEITFEKFHGYNQIEYQARHITLQELLRKTMAEEEAFIKTQTQINQAQGAQKGTPQIADATMNIQHYDQTLKYLLKTEFKVWVPLPSYQIKEIQRNTFAENRSVPLNHLRVRFKRLLNCEQEKYYISFSLEINGVMVSQQTDICGGACVFNYEKDIPLGSDRKSANLLCNNVIEVRILEKGFFHDSLVGQGIIKLSDLEVTNQIETTQDVSKKKKGMLLEYGIYLREPVGKGRNKFSVIKVGKIYPDFNVDEGLDEFIEKMMTTFKQSPGYQQANEKSQSTTHQPLEPQKAQQQVQVGPVDEPSAPVIAKEDEKYVMLIHQDDDEAFCKIKQFTENQTAPQGITNDDILNPENPERFISYSFCEPYTEFLSRKLVELSSDMGMRQQKRYIQKLFDSFSSWKIKIEHKLEDQEFEWYLNQVKLTLDRDMLLAKVYTQIGAKTWIDFVNLRMEGVKTEISELSAQLGV